MQVVIFVFSLILNVFLHLFELCNGYLFEKLAVIQVVKVSRFMKSKKKDSLGKFFRKLPPKHSQ